MAIDDLTRLTAENLLAINAGEPERLFDADPGIAKRQWRALSGFWHPDRNPHKQARWVCGHIQGLYDAARGKREGGSWDLPGRIMFKTIAGKTFRLRYHNKRSLDVGTVYVGREVIAYALETDYADMAEHAFVLLDHLPFADAAMERAMARFLPRPIARLETNDSEVLVLGKSPLFVSLGGLLEHAGGTLECRHVAWIVSALLNLVCYLETAGLAHHAIDPEHLLVAPEKHAIALYGGWWYAGWQHAPMHALPARSTRLAPPDVLHRRLADVRLDQFLLRATALEILGERFDETPTAMQDFLTLPPAPTALEDYERWQQTLWESFGERRFVPLAITPDDIYAMSS